MWEDMVKEILELVEGNEAAKPVKSKLERILSTYGPRHNELAEEAQEAENLRKQIEDLKHADGTNVSSLKSQLADLQKAHQSILKEKKSLEEQVRTKDRFANKRGEEAEAAKKSAEEALAKVRDLERGIKVGDFRSRVNEKLGLNGVKAQQFHEAVKVKPDYTFGLNQETFEIDDKAFDEQVAKIKEDPDFAHFLTASQQAAKPVPQPGNRPPQGFGAIAPLDTAAMAAAHNGPGSKRGGPDYDMLQKAAAQYKMTPRGSGGK